MSATKNSDSQRNADLVRDAATQETAEILQRLNTSPTGLSSGGQSPTEKVAAYQN